MLSKLFSNIRLGIELWFVAFSVLLMVGQYFLMGSGSCVRIVFIPDYNTVRVIVAPLFALTGLLFSQQVFVKRFTVIKGSFYIPFILLLTLSVLHPFFCLEYSFLLILATVLYLNFYAISERGANRSVPYFINVGLITLVVFIFTPLGLVFLLSSWVHTILQGSRGWRSFVVPIYILLFGSGIYFLLDLSFDSIHGSMRLVEQLKPELVSISDLAEHGTELVALLVMLFFALKEYRIMLFRAPVAKRKIMSMLVWQVILSLAGAVLYNWHKDFVWFAFFGTAVLFANYIHYIKRNWIRETWIWALLFIIFLPWFRSLLDGWI